MQNVGYLILDTIVEPPCLAIVLVVRAIGVRAIGEMVPALKKHCSRREHRLLAGE